MLRGVIFDLDETLIHDRASTEAAMASTLADAAAERGFEARAVAAAVLEAAGPLWRAGPQHAYTQRIGISSWEALWASFAAGDDPETLGLRSFAPGYRRAAWSAGLQACGLADPDLCADLSERYVWARASRQQVFAEALPVLVALKAAGQRLVMLTNGDRDLQRRKAVASGLIPLFDHVVISGELGIGKPEPGIFRHALGLAGLAQGEALMVGDSLGRDVAGAVAAGVRAVWVDRFGTGLPAGGPQPWRIVGDLRPLPALAREA